MNKELTTCKECKSEYFTATSKMEKLCPNCAHFLYGYERCYHRFENGERCTKCHWNGNVSEFVTSIIKRNKKKLKSINTSIYVAIFILVISCPLTIIGILNFDVTIFSLAEYSFSRNVPLFLSVFGVLVSIPFLLKARAYKKQLIKEIPYMD